MESRLLTLNEALEEEKLRTPSTLPPTPSFAGTAPPPPTTAGTGAEQKKFTLANREVQTEDRIKDAVGKFAIANYNAGCELERIHRFSDALDFYRKAAEGARQAFGSQHHITVII